MKRIEQRNYQKEGQHVAGWGVSEVLWPSRQNKARDTFYSGQPGRPATQSLVRLQRHPLLP